MAAGPGPWTGTAGPTPASGWSERGRRAVRTLPAWPLRTVGAQVSLLHPRLHPLGPRRGCRASSTRPEGTPTSGGWSQERGLLPPMHSLPVPAKECPAVPRSLPPALPNQDMGTGPAHRSPLLFVWTWWPDPGSAPTPLGHSPSLSAPPSPGSLLLTPPGQGPGARLGSDLGRSRGLGSKDRGSDGLLHP